MFATSLCVDAVLTTWAVFVEGVVWICHLCMSVLQQWLQLIKMVSEFFLYFSWIDWLICYQSGTVLILLFWSVFALLQRKCLKAMFLCLQCLAVNLLWWLFTVLVGLILRLYRVNFACEKLSMIFRGSELSGEFGDCYCVEIRFSSQCNTYIS